MRNLTSCILFLVSNTDEKGDYIKNFLIKLKKIKLQDVLISYTRSHWKHFTVGALLKKKNRKMTVKNSIISREILHHKIAASLHKE